MSAAFSSTCPARQATIKAPDRPTHLADWPVILPGVAGRLCRCSAVGLRRVRVIVRQWFIIDIVPLAPKNGPRRVQSHFTFLLLDARTRWFAAECRLRPPRPARISSRLLNFRPPVANCAGAWRAGCRWRALRSEDVRGSARL